MKEVLDLVKRKCFGNIAKNWLEISLSENELKKTGNVAEFHNRIYDFIKGKEVPKGHSYTL